MEQKVFNKLNLYDEIGYLMVGSIFHSPRIGVVDPP